VPVGEQTAAQTLAQKAVAAGAYGVQVDGNDAVAVREVREEALARGRAGQGPSVIEALTYRLSDHTTADDAARYRPAGELEAAWQREPLARLRALLVGRSAWDDAREAELRAECASRIDEAVQAYFAHPRPEVDSMFAHLFAHLPAGLEEQRAMARRFAGSTGGH
jgi:pyruvate dehydrogenase E1 component alpha subunit